MNMKNIIIEEINRARLLMNYSNDTTLSENLEKLPVLESKSLISEQTSKVLLRALFGTSDEVAIQGLKTSRNAAIRAQYTSGLKLLDDPRIYGTVGFRNADELATALAKGTLNKAQLSGVAKGLLKSGKATGELRTVLTDKAAKLSANNPKYANLGTKAQIKNSLVRKGYDPAIADEIAVKMLNERAKTVGSQVVNSVRGGGGNIGGAGKQLISWRKIMDHVKRNKGKYALGATALAIAAFALLYPGETPPEDTDTGTSTETDNTNVSGRYRDCGAGPFSKGCSETDVNGPIHKLQSCLGVVSDGKFWTKTEAALMSVHSKKSVTTDEINTICNQSNIGNTPQPDNNSGNKPTDSDSELGDEVVLSTDSDF